MEEIGGLLLIWGIHAAIAAFVSAPIVFLGRKRVGWRYWELLVFALPFITWTSLMFSGLEAGRKSMSNLGEPFVFAFAIPVAAAVRVIIGRRASESVCGGTLIVLVCVFAVFVFFATPSLPE